MDIHARPETWAEFRDETPAPPVVVAALLSFDEVYRAELPGLVALARGLCPPAIAEDVAQEAMLVALRRWAYVSRLEHPEAWIRRTCANLAVSQFRRRLVEVRVVARLRSRTAGSSPEPDVDEFWALVRRLPRRQAQVVALYYLYDLGVVEIAATLEVSVGSVKVHLSRARATLRRALTAEADPRPPVGGVDPSEGEVRS
jgi:RNA polymerase sigma-70 factor (ECF subfamily)